MKLKKLIICIFTLLLLFGCDFKKNDNNGELENQPSAKEVENQSKNKSITETDFKNNITNVVEGNKIYSLSIALNEIGIKIIEAKKYNKYNKIDGVYFINLKELNEDFNFDISEFVNDDNTPCDYESTGIYIDIDKILNIQPNSDGDRPIVITNLNGCLIKN